MMKSTADKDQLPSEGRTGETFPIVYIDKSEIREGKYEEIRKSVEHLVAFVEEHVPQLIYYSFCFNEKHTQMTVISVHPDAESLEYHMKVGKEEFSKFSDLLNLLKIEVYGSITGSVLALLRQKAKMLGNGTVEVHEFSAGFFRN